MLLEGGLWEQTDPMYCFGKYAISSVHEGLLYFTPHNPELVVCD